MLCRSQSAHLRRPGGQLRRRAARDGAPRHRPRRSHRPDQRARSAQRLRAERHDARRRARVCARAIPHEYVARSMAAMGVHVEAMLRCSKRGAVTFDYGNNIRTQAKNAGVEHAFDIPGFVPEYIRPLFCEGRGPFRWVALSGDPEDIYRTDQLALELFPHNETLARWLPLARQRIQFQGLPARICWLGYGERAEFGLAINRLVRSGELKAPIVIGRDHLDTGSVASPYRETEGMRDGSRRHRRLAAAQRAGQHRRRRKLGLHPQRRRRRHRLFAARRNGRGRRWHRRNGSPPRARPHQRPRPGRRPPRRRRLPGGHRIRRNSRYSAAGRVGQAWPVQSLRWNRSIATLGE